MTRFWCSKRNVARAATHYHELSVLEQEITGVKNYNIAVKKRGDDITFLRRIVRGPADDSYGIEVAKLAGIPDAVVARAKEVLQAVVAENGGTVAKHPIHIEKEEAQMSFGDTQLSDFVEDLKLLDVNTLTPIEALQTLYTLVKKAQTL